VSYQDLAVIAAQGIDTEDFLRHIAWEEILLPRFQEDRRVLTDRLVQSVLKPETVDSETREQIAGKLWGIDYAIRTINEVVKRGRSAKSELARSNISVQ